jgi:putative flippase GtrA
VTRRPSGEFVRFLVVNGVNTGLYWALYLVLLLVLPYLAANTISLVVAVLVAYWLNARFAFRVGMNGRALAGFAAGQGVTVLLRTAVVWALVDVLGVDERLAPPAAVAIALPVAFLLTKAVMAPSRERVGVPAVSMASPARP